MPYDTLINGREYKLPLHLVDMDPENLHRSNWGEWHVLDADQRFLFEAEHAIAQLIVDTFNAKYREALEKATVHQKRGAYYSDVARALANAAMGATYVVRAAEHYATARDILGITENP